MSLFLQLSSITSVDRTENITEQALDDEYAKNIENTIKNLELKKVEDEDKKTVKATKGVKKNVKTDDVNQPLLWMGIMLVTGGYILIKTKRKENNE